MIEEEIRGEVNDADFYGHMVDETTDISTKNQMSVIVRFVKNGEVKERFLGFYNELIHGPYCEHTSFNFSYIKMVKFW